jgi:hypothetical protein
LELLREIDSTMSDEIRSGEERRKARRRMPKYPQTVIDLGKAIAHAEGFGVPGTVPTRAHNPGDLKIPNWNGAVTGTEGISVFLNDEDGWNHLYDQLLRIQIGNSHVYTLSMTFGEFARHWTDTQETNWIDNVLYLLQSLGHSVDEQTKIGDYFSNG